MTDFSRFLWYGWWGAGQSHAELVIDGVCWSSSARDGGVRQKHIDLASGRWDVIELHLTAEQASRALRWFAIASAQARAGDQSAAQLLPSLSKSLLDLAEANATSLVELQRIRAQTAGSLMQTSTSVAASKGLVLPKFDVGTNNVPFDMIAQIHKGETIIPDAFDPAVFMSDMGMGGNAEVVAAIVALQRQVESLQQYLFNIEKHTGSTSKAADTTANVLTDSARGRRELRVKAIA